MRAAPLPKPSRIGGSVTIPSLIFSPVGWLAALGTASQLRTAFGLCEEA
jgi:hypothetical protein